MDLNLLVALDALLEEGSVSAAADRLGLSQPAMSRTLSRIRRALDDEVLVRSGRLMLPTPYAESVRAEVHELVQRSTSVLSGAPALDLGRLGRTFTLRCHDAIADLLAPVLIPQVREAAPGVRLRFLAEGAGDGDGLRAAVTDLVIGADATSAPDTRTRTIGSSPLVLVAGAAMRLPRVVTATEYAGMDHVTVSRRGRISDPIDDLLAVEGLTRRVIAAVSTARIALDLVSTGAVVATMPALVRHGFPSTVPLVTRAVPLPIRPVEMTMRWHQRHEADAAHRWLRGVVRERLLGWIDGASHEPQR